MGFNCPEADDTLDITGGAITASPWVAGGEAFECHGIAL
jgi:hypothetical protein